MKICKKCDKEYPDSAKFCRTCGGELVGKQQLSSDFQAKDSVYKIKLSETPDDSVILIEYSEFLLAHKANEAAITKMNEFLETSPKNLDVRKLLAKAYKNSDDMEAFVAQLLIIEEFSKGVDIGLKYDLAKAYYDTGNLKQTTDLIDSILKLKPDDIETIKLKADILKKGSDLFAYESCLRKLIQIDPGNNAASELFHHIYEKGKLSEAAKLLEGGYQALSNDPLTFFVSAKERIIQNISENKSDWEVVGVLLDKTLNHDPTLPIKELNEARIYKLYIDAIEKKGAKPSSKWENWQKDNPDSVHKSIYSTIYDESCRYYTKEQNAISEISACKKSIDLEPTDTRYYQLALLYQTQAKNLEEHGDRTGALKYLKEAWSLLEQLPALEREGMDNIESEINRIESLVGKKRRKITSTIFLLVFIVAATIYSARGKIEIEVIPSAYIRLSIAGEPIYETVDSNNLMTDYHWIFEPISVTVQRDGYEAKKEIIFPPFGLRTTRVSLPLKAIVSQISVRSTPDNSLVEVRNRFGKWTCTTPCEMTDVFSANSTIRIYKEGYSTYTANYDLQPGGKHVFSDVFLYSMHIPVLNPKDNMHYYTNHLGERLLPKGFESAKMFSEGVGAVTVEGKCGYISEQGEYLISPQYNYCYSFNEGLAKVVFNGKCGYIDKQGNVRIDIKNFRCSDTFKDNNAVVQYNGRHDWVHTQILDKEYNTIKDSLIRDLDVKNYSNHMFGAFSPRGRAFLGIDGFKVGYGYLDNSGNFIISPEYSDGGEFSREGLAPVCRGGYPKPQIDENCDEARVSCSEEGKWAYIDTTGQVIIDFQYSFARPFSEGLAAVKDEDSKWHFVDVNGQQAFNQQYDCARPFNDGIAYIRKDGQWYPMDRDGKLLSSQGYEDVTDFKNGISIIGERCSYQGERIVAYGKQYVKKPWLACKKRYYMSRDMKNIGLHSRGYIVNSIGSHSKNRDSNNTEMPFRKNQRWKGYYVCGQGSTNLILKISNVSDESISAVFDFNYKNKCKGKFKLRGKYNKGSRSITFKPGKWLKNTCGYSSVGMKGRLSKNGKQFSGSITSSSCGEFKLERI